MDGADRTLDGLVRPPHWQNPRPRSTYDLVVIGGGTAGLVSAVGAAGLGARVALIERDRLGGDCLITGCVPSKAILRTARAVGELRRAEGLGIRSVGAEPDFGQVMTRMRQRRAHLAVNDSADRAVLDDETEGFVRVHHERGRLRGCTIVAAHASEMIGQVSVGLARGASLSDFAAIVYPYPTQGEALRKAGDTYRRALLTPRLRRLFERYFRMTRW